jgi:hypothetical protein
VLKLSHSSLCGDHVRRDAIHHTFRAGHDLVSLFYNFMDACLYAFATDDFIGKDMRVVEAQLPLDTSSSTSTTAQAAAGNAAAEAPFRLTVIA